MVTDQVGRLIAFTCEELSAYRVSELNSIPYGISRVLLAAENAANARGESIRQSQSAAEQIPIVQYSALETAINKLGTAADKLAAALN
jgi:hypothetical protein